MFVSISVHQKRSYESKKNQSQKFPGKILNGNTWGRLFLRQWRTEGMTWSFLYIITSSRKWDRKSLQQAMGHLYCHHACGVCENKCLHNLPINTIMRYNHYFMAQGREKYAINKYFKLPGSKPDVCSECEGMCEASCPYGVSIRSLLSIAHQNLSLI